MVSDTVLIEEVRRNRSVRCWVWQDVEDIFFGVPLNSGSTGWKIHDKSAQLERCAIIQT